MAARFWVTGGTGNWNSTTNWSDTTGGASGSSVPGSADTAALDALSGAGTITLNISPSIQTLTCTGFTGTLAFGTNTITLTLATTATMFSGSLTMTVTGTPVIIFGAGGNGIVKTISPLAVTEANSISFRVTSGTGTVVISTSSAVRDLDFTGSSTQLENRSFTIFGNLTGAAAMTVSSGTTDITFAATSGTKTVNLAGATFNRNFIFNGVGGTWQLLSALTNPSNRTTTLTNGTLDLNGFTFTGQFTSTNSNTRAIAFGTSSMILSSTASFLLSMSQATGFTWTGTGGFIVSAMNSTKTFIFGNAGTSGTTANAPNLTFTTGASIPNIPTGSWFNKLDFGTTSFDPGTTTLNLNALTLSSSGTYTTLSATMRGTGTITPNGKTIAAFTVNTAGTVTLAAALSCTTYTQTAGTINFATFNLTCSGAAAYTAGTLSNIGTITCTTWTVTGTFTLAQGTITPSTSFVLTSGAFNYNSGTLSAVPTFTHTAGTVTLGKSYALTSTGTYTQTAGTLALAGFTLTTGIFSSSNTNTRAIAFGTGNIDLTHTTAATNVLDMATTTGFTYTGTGGFTVADMAVTRTFVFGTAGGTTTNAPNLTFTTGASIATLATGSWFNKLDFGTTSFNPGTTTLNLNALTLSSSGTYTTLSATMRGTGTITPNGKTIAALTVNSAGTATLAAALTLSDALTLTQGTLARSIYTLQSDTFASTGVATRSITGSGTYTITGSGATAFSNASAAGITMSGFTISMTSASAKTFAGGGGTYPTLNQGGAGALTISGNNSFADLTATTRPSTITFTISTTQTFTAFTLSGTAGNLVTINSSTPGSQATLSKSSGIVNANYLSIQDSNATGGATWNSGANSINVSNNSGWIFSVLGNFFLFF